MACSYPYRAVGGLCGLPVGIRTQTARRPGGFPDICPTAEPSTGRQTALADPVGRSVTSPNDKSKGCRGAPSRWRYRGAFLADAPQAPVPPH
ncbi:hypothetical protein A4R44_08699 [Amycolatopsis sp. M39]|nr:hypothetical protein A4R44_08699 [Amycolatopsis sp. M39]